MMNKQMIHVQESDYNANVFLDNYLINHTCKLSGVWWTNRNESVCINIILYMCLKLCVYWHSQFSKIKLVFSLDSDVKVCFFPWILENLRDYYRMLGKTLCLIYSVNRVTKKHVPFLYDSPSRQPTAEAWYNDTTFYTNQRSLKLGNSGCRNNIVKH